MCSETVVYFFNLITPCASCYIYIVLFCTQYCILLYGACMIDTHCMPTTFYIIIHSCKYLNPYSALRSASYPGDGGKAVHIPASLQAKSKTAFKINQFNLVASDLMSLNRTLPDYRSSQ